MPPGPQDIALHEEAMAAKRKQEMEAKRAAGEIGEEEIEKGEGKGQESESAAKETIQPPLLRIEYGKGLAAVSEAT